MFKHFLVPTDGSASAEMAIMTALRFARDIGARVTGLHVVQPFHLLSFQPGMVQSTSENYASESVEQARRYLLTIEQYAREFGVACTTRHVNADSVSDAIIQAAFDERCDLICMATHGRKGVRALFIGSETQRVLTHSQVPVLVLR